ncbi:hypothetical protein HanRHA438_Chr10g0453181 [Helianthus annuus]|nr:hypothetical protein HanRHA438_Chr10g0453181 [Helianthus annuus]
MRLMVIVMGCYLRYWVIGELHFSNNPLVSKTRGLYNVSSTRPIFFKHYCLPKKGCGSPGSHVRRLGGHV